MVTEQDYNNLADDVYNVENSKSDEIVKKGSIVGNDKYIVIHSKDNPDNGMQAMAVAPVDKNGEVDYSEVVIAYAGLNIAL
ncbi:hypothetical protein [Streptococcus pluranimalium]|uniref:Uncharacterized protein n=1 Tax=Streptococcus pluranimalium TaxID=82348 RepID=A0A2L0D3C4_9STRE|nr:hypothetical protein [Streptococcus pluranimalium]AUW96071.1 hypothetical protein C0J00_02480 [Streptococcus pluranimalium]